MFGFDDAIMSKAIPGLISAGGSLLTGFLNNSAASARQDSAQDFSAEQYATRYQTSVKDMQAAGLNPMLAYGGLSGSSPTSSAASSVGTPDLGQSYLQSKLASAQVANVEAQTRKTNADALITETTGLDKAYADLGLTGSQIHNVQAQTSKVIEEINNIPYERDRLKAAANQLHKLAGLQEMQGLSEPARLRLLTQQAQQIISQTKLTNLDVSAAEDLGNIGREAGQLKPVVDILKSLLRK